MRIEKDLLAIRVRKYLPKERLFPAIKVPAEDMPKYLIKKKRKD